MGFFDKVKEKMHQLKEENRNLGSATKRINDDDNFFGNVNRGIKNGDFWEGSYLNMELNPEKNTTYVIYGSNQDDYAFSHREVASVKYMGEGEKVNGLKPKQPQKQQFPKLNLVSSGRFEVIFKDGKKAVIDIRNVKTTYLTQKDKETGEKKFVSHAMYFMDAMESVYNKLPDQHGFSSAE